MSVFKPSDRATSSYTFALFCHDDVYSIHGLWPEWKAPRYPVSCHPEKHFYMQKINSIEDRLNKHWYDRSGKNKHFWKHEYDKHGTCTHLTELEYFSKALDLFDLAMKHGNKWLKQWKLGKNQLHIPVDLNFKFMKKKLLHF